MVQEKQDQNLKAALTYLFGFLTGIFFLMAEKNDQFVRFHAMQSTITFLGLFILNFIPLIQILVIPVSLVLWVVLMYKAYSGEKYKLPYVGDLAEKKLGKAEK